MHRHTTKGWLLASLPCCWQLSPRSPSPRPAATQSPSGTRTPVRPPSRLYISDGDPLHEARMYGMMHIAIHDALNAIDRHSRPYVFDSQAPSGASTAAAVAAAAREVLVPLIGQLPLELVPQFCIDAGVASVEADYTAALAAIPDDQAKVQGIAVGQAAAAAILALRAADGAVGPFLNFSCRRIPLLASTSAHQVSRSSPLRYGKMLPPSC